MNAPQTLSRPLAARITGLPEAAEQTASPRVAQGVIDAALKALDAGYTHYTDRQGIPALRSRVANYLQLRFGVVVKPDEVTITCGATEARFVTLKQLVMPGSHILCPGDSASIAGAAHLIGAAVVKDTADASSIRLAYLTPIDAQDSQHLLLEQALDQKWWVVWDLSQSVDDLSFHPAQIAVLAPRVVSISSLSQAMPGWRVGWMAGSEMASKLRAFKQSMTICTTSVSQWAGMGVVE